MKTNTGISLPASLASLARINTRYLIEWHRAGKLYRSIALPLPPNALTISQKAPVQLTYTLGEEPIREIGRYRERSIELSGSAGYDARPHITPQGNITSALGPAILISFRRFLEEYQEAAASEGAEAPTEIPTETAAQVASFLRSPIVKPHLHLHELVFRALDEDYHLKVEVDQLTVQRSADGDNLAPSWTLQLSAHDEADRPARDGALPDIARELQAVTRAMQTAADATATAQAITAGANAYIRRGLAPLLSTLDQITTAARGTMESARELADIPTDLIRQVSKTAGSIRATVTAIIDEVITYDDELSAEWRLLISTLGLAEDIERQAESASVSAPYSSDEATRTDDPPTLPSSAQTQAPQDTTREPATVYRLRLGEDLRVLADRLFRAPERWTELARLNGWLSERHTPRGTPAREGDLILLPTVGPVATRSTRTPYGHDLFINPETGDLDMMSGDFATIRGAQNIEQAARHRLLTVQGETPILDAYGLPEMIGERITAESAGYLSAHIREQLTRDRRLESVNVIELRDSGDHLNADIEFRAVAGAVFSERIAL